MKKIEIVRYDPELTDEEAEALLDAWREEYCDCMPDDPLIIKKKELLELEFFNKANGICKEAASILEKIITLTQDAELEIIFNL